ncbi:hypothetical protein D1872_220410 [compost metagenome]
MALRDKIKNYRIARQMTHQDLANKLNVERSLMTKVENGTRKWTDSHDAHFASLDWEAMMIIAEERTGGLLFNVLQLIEGHDRHPSAIKELLMEDLDQAQDKLGKVKFASHLDVDAQKQEGEQSWFEMMDVVIRGIVMCGLIEERFQLNRLEIMKRYKYQMKQGLR